MEAGTPALSAASVLQATAAQVLSAAAPTTPAPWRRISGPIKMFDAAHKLRKTAARPERHGTLRTCHVAHSIAKGQRKTRHGAGPQPSLRTGRTGHGDANQDVAHHVKVITPSVLSPLPEPRLGYLRTVPSARMVSPGVRLASAHQARLRTYIIIVLTSHRSRYCRNLQKDMSRCSVDSKH